MTIVEGIGDEVIHIGIGLAVITLSVVAWWSTHIRDVPLYRTIVILERNNHRHANNSTVEPLAGIPVTRAVHTTLTSDGSEPTPLASEATENTDDVNLENSSPTGPNPFSSPSLQSERPLLVGDYVNPPQSAPSPPPEDSSLPPPSSEDTTETDTTQNGTEETEEDKEEEGEPGGGEEEGGGDESRIKIRLKYLNDQEKIVDGKMSELLGDFKKRNFRNELSSNKVVRLIYNGHILQQDNCTLATCGLFNNCVIHCLVHPRRTLPPNPTDNSRSSRFHANAGSANGASDSANNNGSASGATRDGDWSDVGGIFYALVTVILCSVWYWRFQHSHLFSFTATAALSSITAIFSLFVFSICFFNNDEIPIEIM